jgi:hypothetical protein
MRPQTVRLLWGFGVVAAVGAVAGGIAYAAAKPSSTPPKKGPVLTGGLKVPAGATVSLVDANPMSVTAPAGGLVIFHPADGSSIQSIVAELLSLYKIINQSLPLGTTVPFPTAYASLPTPPLPYVYTVTWGSGTTTVVTVTPQ